MKKWITAGIACALLACTQSDPPATETGATAAPEWESTQSGSAVPETTTEPVLTTQSPSAAKRISIAELQPKLASGNVVLVDVRAAQSHAFQHADGAISIPEQEVALRMHELPRDKQIVTYCT